MSARARYVAMFTDEAEAVEFEGLARSSGRDTLPACVLDVLDGSSRTPAYWTWMIRARKNSICRADILSREIARERSEYLAEDDARQAAEDDAYRERQWRESCR